MSSSQKTKVGSFTERWNDTAGIQEAIRIARLEAIRRHAQAGRDLPVWRDEKVVWVAAQEILTQLENEDLQRRVNDD